MKPNIGFCDQGFVITFAAAKEIVHPQLSGMGVSVVNTGCFVGTTLAQPLFGYIADHTWDGTLANGVRIYSTADYQNAFLVMIFFSIIAREIMLGLNPAECKPSHIHTQTCYFRRSYPGEAGITGLSFPGKVTRQESGP
jgi:predicted MFS family arabinose efflux permease